MERTITRMQCVEFCGAVCIREVWTHVNRAVVTLAVRGLFLSGGSIMLHVVHVVISVE